MNDFGYYRAVIENLEQVNATQEEHIKKAASLMADAIAEDRLISVYGGGGHTTLPVGEMFFRAGGTCLYQSHYGNRSFGVQSGAEILAAGAHGELRRLHYEVLRFEKG